MFCYVKNLAEKNSTEHEDLKGLFIYLKNVKK